jgi:hypothetical protein
MEKMIEIVGRDGETQVVPASARFWWEEDEALAGGIGKAFDARGMAVRMRNGKVPPIRIKRFEV